MIVFAQSATENRLDVWQDGKLLESTNPEFQSARERVTKLGLSRKPLRTENANIWQDSSIVRIDFTEVVDSAGRPSPAILVLGSTELRQNRSELVQHVASGMSAIQRNCPAEMIHSAIRETCELIEVSRKRRRKVLILCIIAATLVAFGVIAITQSNA